MKQRLPRRQILPGFIGALVVPERPAAEKEEERQNRKLRAGDPLLTAVAVVLGEDQNDGRPIRRASVASLLDLVAASRT